MKSLNKIWQKDFENLERILSILGNSNLGSYSLKILADISHYPDSIASEVAHDLDIHIATAQKYLKGLEVIGLLKKTVVRTTTREAEQYELAKDIIKIGNKAFYIGVNKNYLCKLREKPKRDEHIMKKYNLRLALNKEELESRILK